MEKQLYEQMAATEERHWWFVARRDIFARVLGSLALQPAARIVDVGCGTGGNLSLLQQFGEVTGLELNQDAATMAAAHGEVVCGGAADAWPIASNSVDVLTAFDVLEHIPDDKAALLNLFAALKTGGHLIVSVPAYQWLWSQHDVELHHQRRYVLPKIVTLTKSAGFAVDYASYHNCLLFPLSCVLRVVSRISGGRVGVEENQVPLRPINWVLRAIYSFERFAVQRRWRIPFGLSIIVVLRKPGLSHPNPDELTID